MSEVEKCLAISLSHAIGYGHINPEYSSENFVADQVC